MMQPERVILRSTGVVAVALLWEAAPRMGWIDPVFLPPFSTVLATLGTMTARGTVFTHVLVSGYRTVAGFALAFATGVPLGIVLGHVCPFAYAVLAPFLRLLSQVNPLSLMPVFLLVFGSGELVKITTIAWAALFPIVFYTVTAVRNLDPGLLKAGRSMTASSWTLVGKVVLPAALPTVWIGVRVASTLVFFMLVGAEMLGTTGGLGWLVHNSAMNYQIPGIYAGALLVIVLGYGLNAFLVDIERRLSVWPAATVGSARSPGPRPRGRHDLAGTVTPGRDVGP